MMWFSVLSVATLVSLVIAFPFNPNEDRTVKIRGAPRNNLSTRADGKFNCDATYADILRTRAKYLKDIRVQGQHQEGNWP